MVDEIQAHIEYLDRVLAELETLELDHEESLVYNYTKNQAELQKDLVKRPEFKIFKKLGIL